MSAEVHIEGTAAGTYRVHVNGVKVDGVRAVNVASEAGAPDVVTLHIVSGRTKVTPPPDHRTLDELVAADTALDEKMRGCD